MSFRKVPCNMGVGKVAAYAMKTWAGGGGGVGS